MTFWGLSVEIIAGIYFVLPWYAGLVLLRGLLWLSPVKILPLQRLLFQATEPVVRSVRSGFGLSLRRWDPSIPATAIAIFLFWSTALRGTLNWILARP